jgi:hypothetical protein
VQPNAFFEISVPHCFAELGDILDGLAADSNDYVIRLNSHPSRETAWLDFRHNDAFDGSFQAQPTRFFSRQRLHGESEIGSVFSICTQGNLFLVALFDSHRQLAALSIAEDL